METTDTPAALEPEMRRQSYRVFKYDEDEVWREQPVMSGEGRWGYTPDAQEIGTAHGPGEYLLVEDDKTYCNARFVTVVAETRYHEHEVPS